MKMQLQTLVGKFSTLTTCDSGMIPAHDIKITHAKQITGMNP